MPKDDKYMKYNYNLHRYELTEDAVFELIGENLNDITDGNVVLKNKLLSDVSEDVYEYIYDNSRSPEFIERILALDEDLRPTVLKMLIAQFSYMLINSRLALYSGVNIAKQSALGEDKIPDIAKSVIREANKKLPRYGFCLKYAGALPPVSPSQIYKGY